MKRTLLVIATALAVSASALAQGSGSGAHMQQKGSHMGDKMGKGSGAPGKADAHGQHGAAQGDTGPSSTAYREANERMHRDMDIVFSGNSDVDFVKGMVPHHQGAIDMAKVVLAHGKDPQIRKLAEEVVKAQEAEIAMMRQWLAANAK